MSNKNNKKGQQGTTGHVMARESLSPITLAWNRKTRLGKLCSSLAHGHKYRFATCVLSF